jgi:hypothetical protein
MKAKIAKLKTSNPMLFEQYTEEQINIIQTEIVNAWVAVKGNGLPPLTEAEKAAMKAKAEKKIADMKNSQMSEWTKAVRDKYVNDAARKTGMTTFLPEGVTPDQAASLVGQLVNE